MDLVSGRHSCKEYVGGGSQKPSWFCYTIALLLVFGALADLGMFREYTAYTSLSVAWQMTAAFVMYSSCVRCNAWRGFLLIIVAGAVVHFLLDLLPVSKPAVFDFEEYKSLIKRLDTGIEMVRQREDRRALLKKEIMLQMSGEEEREEVRKELLRKQQSIGALVGSSEVMPYSLSEVMPKGIRGNYEVVGNGNSIGADTTDEVRQMGINIRGDYNDGF